MNWREAIGNNKNIVFVGESGCGKTELALNCAAELGKFRKNVTLIDMDQTKSVFRSREFKEELSKHNAALLCGEKFLDTPVVPHGVERLLKDKDSINVLDVGGNETGALTMGQFAKQLHVSENIVYFVINPFRIFSLDEKHISDMKERIKAYGRFVEFKLVANPNLGQHTQWEDVIEGISRLKEIFADSDDAPAFITLEETMRSYAEKNLKELKNQKIIYIKKYLQYP